MKKIIFAFFILIIVAHGWCDPVTQLSPVWSITSTTLKGHSVTATVLLKDRDKSPKWENLSLPPPLPVSEAIAKAEDYAKQFMTSNLKQEIGDITIKKVGDGCYVYVVEFKYYPLNGISDGYLPPLQIVVLMDGTVIKFQP
jgi:hypothetical protein